MSKQKGLSAKKENFSQWFPQVITLGELIEYTDVSGCYILRPNAYAIWEKIKSFFDQEIKKLGVKNAYFPLFIPESFLQKEAKHFAGFIPEVAWVTEHGHTKMPERLAVRPTSETSMYDAYAKWIRSHKDLPLLINQWCNIVRWEFKNPIPFLRSREFLWQEGHTAHATKKEAEKEVLVILDLYEKMFKELLAIPMLKGIKSEKEKFAGADYTTSIETFLPTGKALQGGTSHHLGQNFARAFNITFLDKDEKKKHVWQNSWGFSTRTIGALIIMHGDDKGLIIPPRVAPIPIVIVPILFEKTKKAVLKQAQKIKEKLSDFSVHLDDRDEYTPGWKFNEWEVKGVPLRIEIGPQDLEKKQVTLVRRDNHKKQYLPLTKLKKEIKLILNNIQESLLKKAQLFLKKSIVEVKTFAQFKKAIKNKKMVKAQWCSLPDCEDWIRDKTEGAKSINLPFKQPKITGQCIHCDKKAKVIAYFAKSY